MIKSVRVAPGFSLPLNISSATRHNADPIQLIDPPVPPGIVIDSSLSHRSGTTSGIPSFSWLHHEPSKLMGGYQAGTVLIAGSATIVYFPTPHSPDQQYIVHATAKTTSVVQT